MLLWPFRRKKLSLGQHGEKLAGRYLRRLGLKILAKNYRCPTGEIDLIALDPKTRRTDGAETIVFVEVKTRSSDTHASPQAAVNSNKQRRIRKAARYYLSQRNTGGFRVRYDIVAVVIESQQPPKINHIPHAF